MKNTRTHRITIFVACGAAALIAQQPFDRGVSGLPGPVIDVAASGIFAAAMTVGALLCTKGGTRTPTMLTRLALAGLLLTVGQPLALVIGGVMISFSNTFLPGRVFHLNSLGAPFLLGELVAGAVWALFLYLWIRLLDKGSTSKAFLRNLSLVLLIVLIVDLLDLFTQTIWQKSVVLPTASSRTTVFRRSPVLRF